MFSFPISFPISTKACATLAVPACAALAVLACAGCLSVSRRDAGEVPQSFYTVTAEIALLRHESRVAALEYAAAAENTADTGLLRRAADVSAECLQPTLAAGIAARWLEVDPTALDAHRAAGKAALDLHKIEQSAAHYRIILTSSPRGTDGEFAVLETDLSGAGNLFGARQLADLLAGYFPGSPAALRVQAFAALRADDPAAAVHSFQTALATAEDDSSRRELTQGLWRARILSGDSTEPLAQAKDLLDGADTAENRLNYALLLLAAQQTSAARAQFSMLTGDPGSGPLALRLLGLMDYQDGKLDEAGARFAELVTTGKFLDDAIFYLGMIAERHEDLERALRLYGEVQTGDNAVPALLRAASILKRHAAAPAADELLDRLVEEVPQRAPEILAARARIDAESGDLTRAMAVLDKAQIEYPDSVELRYAKASLSEEHGQVAAALRELKAVAVLRPSDPAALNAYGYTLADNGRQLPAARRLIERAHAAAPKNASILDSMGWVLFKQGRSEEALPYLNTAYADDHDGDVAAHLGEVLWHLGRRPEAERIWSDASKTGSDSHLVDTTRVRLHASDQK